MIVIVANDIPDAVRGKLKLWCVEPKPNVFVSGIKDALAEKVVNLVLESCDGDAGLLIFMETGIPPFFKIFAKGTPTKSISTISGFQLVRDSVQDSPFV